MSRDQWAHKDRRVMSGLLDLRASQGLWGRLGLPGLKGPKGPRAKPDPQVPKARSDLADQRVLWEPRGRWALEVSKARPDQRQTTPHLPY